MNNNNEPGTRGQDGLDRLGGHAKHFWVNFRKNGFYPHLQSDIGGGQVAESGDNDLVTGLQPHAEIHQMDGGCAVGCGERKRRAGEGCQFTLKTFNKWPPGNPSRMQRFYKILLFQAPEIRLLPRDAGKSFHRWDTKREAITGAKVKTDFYGSLNSPVCSCVSITLPVSS